MRSIRVTVALLLIALSGAGCSALSDDGPDDGKPSIVAAFYPLQYVATRVAGDHATVTGLTAAGAEPHDLEINIKETGDITSADLVVFEHGFQPAVDDAVEQNATGAVVDASEVVGLLPAEEGEEGEEGHEHGEEEHADEHDHGAFDPHFWQDPARMAKLADAVAASLGQIDPVHAADYTANAAALRTELDKVDAAFRTGLADCDRTTIVVSHDAFGYLEKYGVHVAPIAGLSPDAEPTPADIGELQKLIRADGVTTVFSERLASPELTETLAKDLGIQTAVLDPIEGLVDATSNETYLSLMDSNLVALRKANGCR